MDITGAVIQKLKKRLLLLNRCQDNDFTRLSNIYTVFEIYIPPFAKYYVKNINNLRKFIGKKKKL
jgi:hypothetical protein